LFPYEMCASCRTCSTSSSQADPAFSVCSWSLYNSCSCILNRQVSLTASSSVTSIYSTLNHWGSHRPLHQQSCRSLPLKETRNAHLIPLSLSQPRRLRSCRLHE